MKNYEKKIIHTQKENLLISNEWKADHYFDKVNIVFNKMKLS